MDFFVGFFFHIRILGRSGLVLGGILPLSETQEWSCVLESVTRASVGTGLSSQWAKSQLWRELSLYSDNPIAHLSARASHSSRAFVTKAVSKMKCVIFFLQISRCTSSTRRWTCRICLSRRTRAATAPSSSQPPPSNSTAETVSGRAGRPPPSIHSSLPPSILPLLPPAPAAAGRLRQCTVPRRPPVCLHLHFHACLKQSACS